jgi:DNA-binding GntR family transcriptional regulator
VSGRTGAAGAARSDGGPGRRERDAVSDATEAVRTMILTGRLAPGTELSQVALAEAVGMSTTPLREALRRLEAEGLVESPRNRRPRVPSFDPADLDAVYCNRVLLEPLALVLAAPMRGEGELAQLRGRLAEMRGAPDPRSWDRAHAAFHAGLVAGGNLPLRQDIGRLMARADRYRRMSVRSDDSDGRRIGDHEHEAILSALERGESREAALLLARHLTRSALTVVAQLAPDFDPAAVRGALQAVIGWTEPSERSPTWR